MTRLAMFWHDLLGHRMIRRRRAGMDYVLCQTCGSCWWLETKP